MEQHTFKNVNNCLNTNLSSNLETSGGQSSNGWGKNPPWFSAIFRTTEKLENPNTVGRKTHREKTRWRKNGSAHFYFLNTVWWKKWRARPSVSVCCKLPESYFSTVLYLVFIFQILKCGKSGECNPQCQCDVNYPKVIFPFFHRTVFGFYFPNNDLY
jgi:hypothetical protein